MWSPVSCHHVMWGINTRIQRWRPFLANRLVLSPPFLRNGRQEAARPAVSLSALLDPAGFKQAPGNHLCLNFRGSLKNIENARVAQDAGNGIFQRKAIPAMDL